MVPVLPSGCRVLVTGITSIHGWPIYNALKALLPPDRLHGIAPPKTRLDSMDGVSIACITEKNLLADIVHGFRPTHIVHGAGVCDLDVCEKLPDWAWSRNVGGTGTICALAGTAVPVIYISSDLVFSGNNPPAAGYAEHHVPDPVSVVGRTYAEAERLVAALPGSCIVRIGLPLGDSVYGTKGAVDWIGGRLRRNLPVTLFYDEFRSCIGCDEVGAMAVTVLSRGLTGLYHFGGDRVWSLYEIGTYVQDTFGYAPGLLTGRYRHQEVDGPPRIGNVGLDSSRYRGAVRP